MSENPQITVMQQKLDELMKFRDQEEDFDVEKLKILRNEISSMLEKRYKRKFDLLTFYEMIDDLPF